MSYSLNSLKGDIWGIICGSDLGIRVQCLGSKLLKGGYIGDYIWLGFRSKDLGIRVQGLGSKLFKGGIWGII